jgi:hypothetical protein
MPFIITEAEIDVLFDDLTATLDAVLGDLGGLSEPKEAA